jgi:hypothetical protein
VSLVIRTTTTTRYSTQLDTVTHRDVSRADLRSLAELYASGAIAGVANTIVSNPVEHIRIRQSHFLATLSTLMCPQDFKLSQLLRRSYMPDHGTAQQSFIKQEV